MAEAIIKMTGPKLSDRTAVLSTTTVFNIESLPEDKYTYIINLRKINDIKQLDSFIDAVNHKLEPKGYFFCCVETKDQRKKRILKKFPLVINYILYSFDFVVKRVLPKLKITRPLYNVLTRGNNSVISRAEALGRLCRGGFRIRQESFIGNNLCIEAKKVSDPLPTNGYYYGPIIALPRIGKNGEIIRVYKLRTMHPYSEYIQDYVYQVHDLQDGGKFKNDFRITSWGSACRKVWIDELPTFINLVEGNMKLVGVRPLSKHYFELYDKDLQDRRTKYKPGLVPPYYADMPGDLESIQASEKKYLDSYDRHPFLTDTKYFFNSWWNILFHHARSW
jgi:lipopolysaccharide/colanic/teichoic acid biosynthesis glycosyltransferase